jgi:hypothetical protein
MDARAVEEWPPPRKHHAAVAGSSQALLREMRTQRVPQQMHESFAVALVDMGTCLQREPIEEGDQLLRLCWPPEQRR